MILRPVLFFFARAPASGSGQSIKGMINGSGCQSTRARVPISRRYPETSVPAVCPDRAGPFMKQNSAAKAPAPGYVMPVILVKFPDDLIDMLLSHARGLPCIRFLVPGTVSFKRKWGFGGFAPKRQGPGVGRGRGQERFPGIPAAKGMANIRLWNFFTGSP